MAIPFACEFRARFWLQRDAEQIQGSLLDCRWLGQFVELRAGLPSHPHSVLRQRTQIGHQSAEAVYGQSIRRLLGPVFSSSSLRARGWLYYRSSRSLCCLSLVIVKQKRGELFTHMPFDVIRQHTEKDVCTNSVVQPVKNRANLQIHRLYASKVILSGNAMPLLSFCQALADGVLVRSSLFEIGGKPV